MCVYESRRWSGPRSLSANKLMILKLNENRKWGLSINVQPFLPAMSIIQCMHKRSVCFRLFLNIKSLHAAISSPDLWMWGFCFSNPLRCFLACSGSHIWIKLSDWFYLYISCNHQDFEQTNTVFQSLPIVVSGLQFITQLHKHSYRAAQQRRFVLLYCVGKQAREVTFCS